MTCWTISAQRSSRSMVDVPGIEDQLEFVGTTMGLSQSLEQPCGEARMTYQIHYQTAASDPGTAP